METLLSTLCLTIAVLLGIVWKNFLCPSMRGVPVSIGVGE